MGITVEAVQRQLRYALSTGNTQQAIINLLKDYRFSDEAIDTAKLTLSFKGSEKIIETLSKDDELLDAIFEGAEATYIFLNARNLIEELFETLSQVIKDDSASQHGFEKINKALEVPPQRLALIEALRKNDLDTVKAFARGEAPEQLKSEIDSSNHIKPRFTVAAKHIDLNEPPNTQLSASPIPENINNPAATQNFTT